jgi:hypothetical protein
MQSPWPWGLRRRRRHGGPAALKSLQDPLPPPVHSTSTATGVLVLQRCRRSGGCKEEDKLLKKITLLYTYKL